MKLKNLNRPITRSEIESVIKKELPTNKSPESGSQANLSNIQGRIYTDPS